MNSKYTRDVLDSAAGHFVNIPWASLHGYSAVDEHRLVVSPERSVTKISKASTLWTVRCVVLLVSFVPDRKFCPTRIIVPIIETLATSSSLKWTINLPVPSVSFVALAGAVALAAVISEDNGKLDGVKVNGDIVVGVEVLNVVIVGLVEPSGRIMLK